MCLSPSFLSRCPTRGRQGSGVTERSGGWSELQGGDTVVPKPLNHSAPQFPRLSRSGS